jgi:uncharacterized protein YndB with AHSA1/START domain
MSDLATITEHTAVELVRSLAGPIERVWAYLTDPKLLAKWFSDGVVADHVGGGVRFDMGPTGRITAYEPPHLLEYTWNTQESDCGPVVNTLVRWELAKDGNRVRLTVKHSRLNENALVSHAAGWHTFLERLQACIEDRNPVPTQPRFAELKAEYAKRWDHVC